MRFLLCFLLLSLASVVEAASRAHLVLGPMVGHVGPGEARIWVRSSAPGRWSVKVSANADLSRSKEVRGPALNRDNGYMGTAVIMGLKPNSTYHYAIFLNGRLAQVPPYGYFTTAPEPGEAGTLRFAFGSCFGYETYESAPGWADIGTRTNVDLFLLLGDNHYANSIDPEKQRAAYLGQRITGGFHDFAARVPNYGIWDDHDFGPDNSDSTLPGKELSLKTFREHWGNPAYGEKNNPGVYYKFTRGQVEFFMLDGRYYRTPNKATNAPNRTMLGARQLEWLKESLLNSKAKVKVIGAGSEWQSHSTADCWSNFKKERDEIFAFIDQNKVEGVLLISGDRHFTAAYQVTGRFIEVTSGPFGGQTLETRTLPEMFMQFPKGRYYAVYAINTAAQTPEITLEVYRVAEGLVARRKFTWDEVNGRSKLSMAPAKN